MNIIHDLNKNKLISPLASFNNSNKGKINIRKIKKRKKIII